MLTGKKAFFAGVNSANKPGSIQTILYPDWAVISETQLHSSGISRMCINFDHTLLFSASFDGSISYLQVQDKDPRKRESMPAIAFTTEIMIPKTKRDTLIKQIGELKSQIEIYKSTNQRLYDEAVLQKKRKLESLDKQLKQEEEEAYGKQLKLENKRAQMVDEKKQIQVTMEQQHLRVLQRMLEDNLSKQKMDASKFNELQDNYLAAQKNFQETMYSIKVSQKKQIEEMDVATIAEKEKNRTEILKLEE